ncbi:hypothetical protein EVA_03241 [gut metagenome]|uniref:Uncharacterized protein n=1 Tax=gut metagenome TaxID=749906 RepID=J9H4F0_9ZZZZ
MPGHTFAPTLLPRSAAFGGEKPLPQKGPSKPAELTVWRRSRQDPKPVTGNVVRLISNRTGRRYNTTVYRA